MAKCLWHKAMASDAGWKLPWMRQRLLAKVYKQKLGSMGCMGMGAWPAGIHGYTARAHLRAPPIPPARPPAAPCAPGPAPHAAPPGPPRELY
jgi:hypothetical protein